MNHEWMLVVDSRQSVPVEQKKNVMYLEIHHFCILRIKEITTFTINIYLSQISILIRFFFFGMLFLSFTNSYQILS